MTQGPINIEIKASEAAQMVMDLRFAATYSEDNGDVQAAERMRAHADRIQKVLGVRRAKDAPSA